MVGNTALEAARSTVSSACCNSASASADGEEEDEEVEGERAKEDV